MHILEVVELHLDTIIVCLVHSKIVDEVEDDGKDYCGANEDLACDFNHKKSVVAIWIIATKVKDCSKEQKGSNEYSPSYKPWNPKVFTAFHFDSP